MRPAGAAAATIALMISIGGCGGGGGVAAGASVTVYAAHGACAEARHELARKRSGVDSLRLRVVCLAPVRHGNRLDLAAVGANARRAAEDSTTIAYIGELSAAATRFSETILEEADIGQVAETPGRRAMREVLAAVAEADTTSEGLREEVRESLERAG